MTNSTTLAAIATRVGADVIGDSTVDVSGASHDSRNVQPGQLFACLRGHEFDGHEHAAAAIESGAVALLVDHHLGDLADTPQIVVPDTRLAVGPASAAAWGDPANRLLMIGITGTNGKTTTAQLVAAALDGAGVATGIIGTLHGPRTTPEAPELHAMLSAFESDGRRAVVMEVSSHALELHRIDGTRFDVVGFTNFGHDHLDLHGSPEAYFRAKSALFTQAFSPRAVIDVDSTHGRLLADAVDDDLVVKRVARSDLLDVVVGFTDHRFRWRGRDVTVALGGDFNVSNSQMALELVSSVFGAENAAPIEIDQAIAGLSTIDPIPGRFESIRTEQTVERGIDVVIDYAHTPDGLERLLESARHVSRNKVIVVFGCAGRRDREKRPAMGEIAGRLADVAVATSDNPRSEDPDAIIDDVLAGVARADRSKVVAEPDRRTAIRRALDLADAGDIVVIAGKGHETYQDVGSAIIDFDDRAVARDELARHEPKDLA